MYEGYPIWRDGGPPILIVSVAILATPTGLLYALFRVLFAVLRGSLGVTDAALAGLAATLLVICSVLLMKGEKITDQLAVAAVWSLVGAIVGVISHIATVRANSDK